LLNQLLQIADTQRQCLEVAIDRPAFNR